ncbi:hypothetical protein ATO12_13765 [Aquimarina atlantica]|uniref:Polymer-forming cytoskeletal protein n=1 Tax=Aquimarina atlantica TaxID=1317122 RepID=A0A023BVE3_9FLAO|nr:hypothetical protein [Aquimarina atlantica]EZH73945.1 hypothetical protein ATO12_13765 [Aquimarina atlantica]
MIKAGSIAYAILICIVVGIFCYSLLLMSGYAKIHQGMLDAHAELVSNNESAQEYFLAKIEDIEEKRITVDVFDNGMVSSGRIKPWGFYKVLLTTSVFKKDTIKRAALIGQWQKEDALALYLSDASKPLFMVEKAKITGNVFLPKSGIKAGYITSNAYRDTKFLIGTKRNSKTSLPKIDHIDFAYDIDNARQIRLNEIKDNVVLYNGFSKQTLVIESDTIIVDNKKLSGNIVIKSKDSIYIKKNNVLEDIIIEAPKVAFESGFVGNVQVLAEKVVGLEENVVLKYPSGILMNTGNVDKREVVIGKKSKILGGVVINDINRGLDKIITVEEDAEVIGDIYCSGKLQLKGNVIGTVYTSNFYLRTEASAYDNYILNGTIDRKSLPDEFVRIPLFKNKSEYFKPYAIIKQI